MEFIKQDDQNQIQKHFAKKLKKGIFQVRVCLSLFLGLTANSFAGLKEAQNYAVNGLNDLRNDPTSGLYSCSPAADRALIYIFNATIERLELNIASSGNLLFEEFTHGYGNSVMGIE